MPFKCPDCGHQTLITKQTAKIHLFPTQPEFDYVEIHCSCGRHWCVFKLTTLFMKLFTAGVGYTTHQKPTPDIIKAYLGLYSCDEDAVTYFHRILMDVSEVSDIDWGTRGHT